MTQTYPLLGFVNNNYTINAIKTLLLRNYEANGPLKVFIQCNIDFIKDGTLIPVVFNISLTTKPLLNLYELQDFIATLREDIIDKIESFEIRGSGWRIAKFVDINLNINKYKPLKGGSYIRTPDDLVNVKQSRRTARIFAKSQDKYTFIFIVTFIFICLST